METPFLLATTPHPLDQERKLAMLELLNEININIANAIELDDVLSVTCKQLGRLFRCDRVSILVRDSRYTDALITQGEYLRGPYPSQIGTPIPISSNPHLQALIDQPNQVLALTDFLQFPGLSEEVVAIIEALEIKSMLASATSFRGEVNGVVGLQQCDRQRRWEPWEQQLLQQVSRQLGIAIGQATLYHSARSAALQESLMRQVSDRIRASSDLQDILQTAVEGARTLIQADRVAIYQFQQGWKGRVVVEDVATPWPSVLGEIGADDCFSGKYAELYRNGRVRAIDDVETDPKLDTCHVQFLRSLDVRANLIVPITLNVASELGFAAPPTSESLAPAPIPTDTASPTASPIKSPTAFATRSAHRSTGKPGERLWGLLIAHQCDRPRRWQNRDIQLLSQLAGQIAIALRQIELDERLQAQARRERLLRRTSEQIRASFDLMTILQTAVTSIRELLGSSRVTAYRFRDDLDGDVVVESVARSSWSILNRNIRDNCFGTSSAPAYLAGRVRSVNDIGNAPQLDACHRQFLIDIDVKAYAIAPIVIRPRRLDHSAASTDEPLRLWGLAVVHECDAPRDWQESDLSLLRQVTDQMAIAIQQATLYDRTRTQATELQATLDQLRSTQAQLLRSEKLSGLGKMAAGVAHEINNANNFIFANLHHAQSYAEDLIMALDRVDGEPAAIAKEEIDFDYIRDDFGKLWTSIESGSQRIKHIVESLQQFNNSDRTDWQLIRLSNCVESALSRRRSRFTEAHIEVVKEFEPLPCLECNPAQVQRAIGSILDNAIDAIVAHQAVDDRPGTITLTLSDRQNWIELTVTDNGCGIPENHRSRIFDPFFTSKDVGSGIGLGLTTAYQILVEGHGGKIDVDSHVGQGTAIVVLLPVSQA